MRFTCNVLAVVVLVIGVALGGQMYVDTITDTYLWADHMPVVAVLVGAVGAMCLAKAGKLMT